MYPTMPEVAISISSQLHRYGCNVKIGDIIWAQSPYFQHSNVCKRVIGMPGDYVVLDNASADKIGGAPIPGKPGHEDENDRKEPTMVQVPEGHVWLAGDNLPYSRDSRAYGPMPMALIKGKILATSDGWFSRNWKWFGDNDQLVSQAEIEKREAAEAARDA